MAQTAVIFSGGWVFRMVSYYIYLKEQQLGPYTEDQLREMLSSGQVTEECLAWKEGTPDWVPLKTYGLSQSSPKLKLKAFPAVPSAPNPLVRAAEAKVKKQEQQLAAMRQTMGRSPLSASAPLGFMDRLSNAWSLMGASFQILWANKSMLILPLISSICAIFILISFAVPAVLFFHSHPELLKNNSEHHFVMSWGHYAYIFAFYFCNYFVIIFFNAALIACASSYMQGSPCSVRDGLKIAVSRLPSILGWAAIAATVGLLLQAIENALRERSRWLAQIVVGLIGAAWTVVTFLVLPVLVIEKVGPITALKSSVQMFKKTWGEQIAGNVGFGIAFFLLSIPGIFLLLVGVFLGFKSNSLIIGGLWVGLAVVYFILMALAQAAMQVIYQTALYYYAHDGIAPAGFDETSLANSFSRR